MKDINKTIENNTDNYFLKTREIVSQNNNVEVVYAIFLRRKSLYAPMFVLNFLKKIRAVAKNPIHLHSPWEEGAEVDAEEPLFFLVGMYKDLCILETLILQKIGASCVAAYEAYQMCKLLPRVSFISMGARHYGCPEVSDLVDYGVSIGSKKAQKLYGAKGFYGSSTKAGSEFFNLKEGLGTMPHSLIGYAGSTLDAARLYRKTYPEGNLTVLVDYFGKEIEDTLAVCKEFKDLAHSGGLYIRLDTHGKRFMQGLDYKKSWEILKQFVKPSVLNGFKKKDHKILAGRGVSVAAVFYLKKILTDNGFNAVQIVGSSSFSLGKCSIMAKANAPLGCVGTGSILGGSFSDFSATADVISYDGQTMVKVGRENLIKSWCNYNKKHLA